MKAMRIFNPQQVCTLDTDHLDIDSFSLISMIQFCGLAKTANHKLPLPNYAREMTRIPLNEFDKMKKSRSTYFSNLLRKAKTHLSIVTNWVGADRSMSFHWEVFTPQWQAMAEYRVNQINMLTFNSQIQCARPLFLFSPTCAFSKRCFCSVNFVFT